MRLQNLHYFFPAALIWVGLACSAAHAADAIRPTSRATFQELHRRKVRVAMITGDNRPTAERVAALAQHGVVAVRQIQNHLVNASSLGGSQRVMTPCVVTPFS